MMRGTRLAAPIEATRTRACSVLPICRNRPETRLRQGCRAIGTVLLRAPARAVGKRNGLLHRDGRASSTVQPVIG